MERQLSHTRDRVHIALAVLLFGCGSGGGGGDGGDDTNIDGPPGVIDAPVPRPDASPGCIMYCAQIATACTDTRVQFATEDDCLNSCATWRAGQPTDTTGNSLACRTYHVGLAMTDPVGHCLHAGPSGDGVCGVACTGLCSLLDYACTGTNQVYPEHNVCHTTCVTWPTDPPYSANVQTGDSFACRLYHATAATTSPSTHCQHTADNSSTCQ